MYNEDSAEKFAFIPCMSIENEVSFIIFTGSFVFEVDIDQNGQRPDILFTENETNFKRIFRLNNSSPYVKDAFHRLLLFGKLLKLLNQLLHCCNLYSVFMLL